MKKTSQKNMTKRLIKYIKKENREQFWKMTHIKFIFLLGNVSMVLFIVSYFLNAYDTWFSNLFQALGVGIITGMIVYLIGNMRARKQGFLKSVMEQLDSAYQCIKQIYNIHAYFSRWDILSDEMKIKSKYVYEAIDCAREYVDIVERFDVSLLKKLIKDTNTDFDNIREKLLQIEKNTSENLGYRDSRKIIENIIEVIQKTEDWVDDERRRVEIQIRLLDKYPF